ncbi:D-alanyl-D-alanine carboxypeptidase/D-alanyl-D-alanine-endopeptidase [bacterium]|nr:D-alanyl-D-alanine carboxypeptidase/D-alanyl-D-alanine-endopeptidase [bacterium]
MRHLSILLPLLFLSTISQAVAESRITKIIDQMGSGVDQSVSVVRVRDGKLLYAYNKDRLLTPASVTKLVTSGAALKLWGSGHTFKTDIYYTGRKTNGTIFGDLYIKGDGDPYLVSEKLWQMAADLRNMGIGHIKGNIVLDQSLFDRETRDVSRKNGSGSSRNAYDAPVSALGVNFNTFEVMVAPSQKIGSKALVSLSPYPVRTISVKNDVKTVSRSYASRPKVRRISQTNGSSTLLASGKISASAKAFKVYRSVNDPGLSSGEIIRSFLQKEGIKVEGRVREGNLPKTSTYLYSIDSYPMGKIVKGLNNFSNNFIADVLVKRMGAAFHNRTRPDLPGSGSYENGVEVLTRFLKEDIGVKTKFVLENGSGLSIKNKLSSSILANLMSEMSSELESFPEFLASLPTSGVDGTLKKRFKSPLTKHLKGKVRAKTGTLTQPVSVSSLTGYVNHKDHGLLAFSIIQNGKLGKPQPNILDLRLSQERILVKTITSL